MPDGVWVPDFTIATVVLIGGASLLARYLLRKDNGPLPPGPKPRFLIGNALDIPFKKQGQSYLALSKEHGSDIIHLNTLGTRIMVLNSREAAEELFDKRAAIYLSRPEIPTVNLIGWQWNIAILPYGDRWRHVRRICHQSLKAQTASQFHPIQIRKVHNMLAGLLGNPERFDDHNKMLSIAIPLTTMYGYEITSLDDPVIEAADRCLELGSKVISPAGSWANFLPVLKYIPWTWTQRMAKEIRHHASEMKRIPMERLLKQIEQGSAIPSMMGNFLEKKQVSGATAEEEEVMRDITITVYAGASDTTISATRTLFYQLLTHPEVQKKAQAELDQVLGSRPRFPTFEDRASLPYIEAIYREVLRWCPPLPVGVAHCNIRDDWYNGYFIPKGTMVLANIWGINRDKKHYGEDSYEFNPDRFFDENGNLNDDKRILAYGYGRRVCVGQYVASSTLWLIIASVLASFNLRQAKDENGNDIEINHEFDEDGFISHKLPFKCDFVPRSMEWSELIEATKSKGYEF